MNGWAPGSYANKCSICGSEFLGDKRAIACADCAYQNHIKELKSLLNDVLNDNGYAGHTTSATLNRIDAFLDKDILKTKIGTI